MYDYLSLIFDWDDLHGNLLPSDLDIFTYILYQKKESVIMQNGKHARKTVQIASPKRKLPSEPS